MNKKILVLGCGPAGLLVAHAVEEAGYEPIIWSRKMKSHIPGSQHLHGPVPGVTPMYPEGTIQFVRLGTAEGYAQKVYGDQSRPTGWDNYLQVFPSWNVLRAYDKLWERFKDRILDLHVTTGVIGQMVARDNFDVVISTLPAQAICLGKCIFRGTQYYIRELPTPPADAEHELVVYNGLPDDPWYRWSILGGLCSIEYARPPHPNAENNWRGEGWTTGLKAIDNTCDCWPTVHRCGRWAEWHHGVTMFRAYQKATEIMKGLT